MKNFNPLFAVLYLRYMIKHFFRTTVHKGWVFFYLIRICSKLIWRGLTHDLSKYHGIEAKLMSEHLNKSEGLTFGTPEYEEVSKLLAPALESHYKNNRHHIQHHRNGIHDFTLVDLIEFYCDNLAACKRQADGNIDKSIDIAEKRFTIDHQIAEVLHNQVRDDHENKD